jgi:hypothetical protein
MKLFSEIDQIHTSEQWIQDTLDLCNAEEEKQDIIIVKVKRKNQHARKLYPVLAALAVVIVVPFSVVAATHLMSVIKNENGADVIMNRGTIAVEDIVPMKIDVSYIPEGMIKDSGGPKYSYKQTPNQGGFSLQLWRLDSETDNFEFPVDDAISSQDMEINGYEAVLLQKEKRNNAGIASNNIGIAFDRQMFIYYADKGYVIQVFIGEDMSEKEIMKFAKGLTLVETEDDETDGTWTSYIKAKESKSEPVIIDDNFNKKAKIGSTIDKATFTEIFKPGEPVVGNGQFNSAVQLTVDKITVQKNFDGITTNSIGRLEDFSSYLNANGQLAEEGFSVVVIDMHYKNISDSNLPYEYCICPYIEAIGEEDDRYVILATKTGADQSSALFQLGFNEGHFSFYTDIPGAHNEIAALSPGQEANVRLAFIVKDEYLQDMFLVQNINGWDIISENQYVDIRQK